MRKFFVFLLLAFSLQVFAADVKISQLPLGSAATTGINDSFPFVSSAANVTKRLTLWDLINLPPLVSTYAKLASPTFTGTVTAPTFAGALSGNVTTATALAANPTDCSADTYANAIAANGNLTCASITNASTTATNANTVSTIVLRDGSGNFSAGTISAALTGTASGNTTYTANNHGVVVSGSANAMSVIAPDASTSKVLKSGGASANPSWLAYDNANTVSTLVARDGSGNFSAGTVTATVTGTASGNTTYTANNHGVVLSGSGNTMTVLAPDSSTTKILKSGGSSADPSWAALSAIFTAPTVQIFTSGSGTYTTPAGVLYIKVTVVGAGGGGGGSSNSSNNATDGGAGSNTTFGSSLLTAGGGGAGPHGAGGVAAGGTNTINAPAVTIRNVVGGQGGGAGNTGTATTVSGGIGGSGPLGGAGSSGGNVQGTAAANNTGSGGGGGGTPGSSGNVYGGGGGAGGFVQAMISSPSATYAYSVGGTATAGSAGSSGFQGGQGGSGIVTVEEFYQ